MHYNVHCVFSDSHPFIKIVYLFLPIQIRRKSYERKSKAPDSLDRLAHLHTHGLQDGFGSEAPHGTLP